MPGCAAPKCHNSSSKGYKMCYFPFKDPERCALWIKNVNRDNWTPSRHSALCQVHFSPETWEQHRTDGLLKLKNNAVPRLFENLGTETEMSETSESGNDETTIIENVEMLDVDDNDHISYVEHIEKLKNSYLKSEEIRLKTEKKLRNAKLKIKRLQKQIENSYSWLPPDLRSVWKTEYNSLL